MNKMKLYVYFDGNFVYSSKFHFACFDLVKFIAMAVFDVFCLLCRVWSSPNCCVGSTAKTVLSTTFAQPVHLTARHALRHLSRLTRC